MFDSDSILQKIDSFVKKSILLPDSLLFDFYENRFFTLGIEEVIFFLKSLFFLENVLTERSEKDIWRSVKPAF